jgi:membrane fusion protein (multidrug efflux system)
MLVCAGCGKGKTPKIPLPSVEVTPVVQRDVPVYAEWVGTLDGNVNATIRAQVQGYLIRQLYQEGDLVKKGQVLFEIDPRTFQAAYDEAKGQVNMYSAKWDQAKSTLARVRPLAEQRALSQKDLDDAVAAEKSARASLDMAKADLEKARLNLSFTRITSPIDGIAGIAKAQIGNLISPQSSEELTTVSQVDPIKVSIAISEQQYLLAVKNLQGTGREARLALILSDGSVFPHPGSFSAADRQVDVKTGTLKVEALFPNPGNVLRPGQFAKIRAMLATRKDALLIPERCLTELQGQYQVAVVGPDNKADIRTVKIGQKTDGFVVVDEGLKVGEKVVVEGTQRLTQGGEVVVKTAAGTAAPGTAPSGETGKE